jgi:hypothetical protein
LLHEDPRRFTSPTRPAVKARALTQAGRRGPGCFRDIATVMVCAEPFVEYLHLARFDSRWLIANPLYLELA